MLYQDQFTCHREYYADPRLCGSFLTSEEIKSGKTTHLKPVSQTGDMVFEGWMVQMRLASCIMGSVGSFDFGACPTIGTKSQDILAFAASIWKIIFF